MTRGKVFRGRCMACGAVCHATLCRDHMDLADALEIPYEEESLYMPELDPDLHQDPDRLLTPDEIRMWAAHRVATMTRGELRSIREAFDPQEETPECEAPELIAA